MVIVWLVLLVLQRRSYFGRAVYAVGGGPLAARLSGIRTTRVTALVYAVAGATAAMGGLVAVGRIGAATPIVDNTLPLQAIAAILTILIIGQQGYTGGVNGITDLRTMLGWDIRTDDAKVTLYFVNAILLLGCLLLAQLVKISKFGRLMIAIRDKEDRVRFSGYDVASFKIFIFCLAAALSAIGGAMFTLQVGFMSPSFVGIVPSIEMVIYCAVGGRLSLFGAIYGALIVNGAKTAFSESFPELWLFAMGGLFIAVVMAFPNGVAGLVRSHIEPFIGRLFSGLGRGRTGTADASPAE